MCSRLALATDNVQRDSFNLLALAKELQSCKEELLSLGKEKDKMLAAGAKHSLGILLKRQRSNFTSDATELMEMVDPALDQKALTKVGTEALAQYNIG